MAEQIIAAASTEQRAILAPHAERLERAEREAAEAKAVILAAVRAFWPDALAPGVQYDTTRAVLWKSAEQEATDGAA
jgi:hypothetical protein